VSLEKTLNAVSHLGAKQSTRCGVPTWRKTWKQNNFCVWVVWQTQSITTSGSNKEERFIAKQFSGYVDNTVKLNKKKRRRGYRY